MANSICGIQSCIITYASVRLLLLRCSVSRHGCFRLMFPIVIQEGRLLWRNRQKAASSSIIIYKTALSTELIKL